MKTTDQTMPLPTQFEDLCQRRKYNRKIIGDLYGIVEQLEGVVDYVMQQDMLLDQMIIEYYHSRGVEHVPVCVLENFGDLEE